MIENGYGPTYISIELYFMFSIFMKMCNAYFYRWHICVLTCLASTTNLSACQFLRAVGKQEMYGKIQFLASPEVIFLLFLATLIMNPIIATLIYYPCTVSLPALD